MIKITVRKKDGNVSYLSIKGHSLYDTKGHDIVCAGASSIVITSINAIIRLKQDAISYNQDEGLVEVTIQKHSKEVDLLIDNMLDLLHQLEQQYPKYVKIYE